MAKMITVRTESQQPEDIMLNLEQITYIGLKWRKVHLVGGDIVTISLESLNSLISALRYNNALEN